MARNSSFDGAVHLLAKARGEAIGRRIDAQLLQRREYTRVPVLVTGHRNHDHLLDWIRDLGREGGIFADRGQLVHDDRFDSRAEIGRERVANDKRGPRLPRGKRRRAPLWCRPHQGGPGLVQGRRLRRRDAHPPLISTQPRP